MGKHPDGARTGAGATTLPRSIPRQGACLDAPGSAAPRGRAGGRRGWGEGMQSTVSLAASAAAVRTADGVPLKLKLQRVERRRRVVSLALVAPLTLFLLVMFIYPIASMIWYSVDNAEFVEAVPRTMEAAKSWDGTGLPDEPVFQALVEDLREAVAKDPAIVGRLAKRINYEIDASRGVILKTGRAVRRLTQGPYKQALIEVDERWGQREYWAVFKRNTGPRTDFYIISSVDRKRNVDGEIVRVPDNIAIFLDVYLRTFWISLGVMVGCLVLGYPVAYLLANLPARAANMLMFFVLLPFWTALLVRTTAWMVLLQRHGVVNEGLLALGVIEERLQLILNLFGLFVAMIHVLLPFMILPLYSVMSGIDRQHMRAARSLGANSFLAFWRIYFPQSLPGVSAGSLLVFILALGYYITPRLVGGPADQMISHFIAFYTDELLNWGQASALALVLLAAVLLLYVFYHRYVGLDSLKLR
jgi:putative spermidine/putrescine transport system permease protein